MINCNTSPGMIITEITCTLDASYCLSGNNYDYVHEINGGGGGGELTQKKPVATPKLVN